MKIAVISDIHSNYEALSSVINHIEKQDIDHIFCCGDLIGYNSRPNEVIEYLREKSIESVRGNHDEALFERPSNFNLTAKKCLDVNKSLLTEQNLQYLRELDYKKEHELKGKTILQVHGSPNDPIHAYIYRESVDKKFIEEQGTTQDIVLMGQTHQPYVKKVGNILFVNPGSVGQPRDGDPRASYAVVDLDANEASIIRREYDIDCTVEHNNQTDIPSEVGERLYKGI